MFSAWNFKTLKLNNVYEYPWWGNVIGFSMAGSSMLCIPLYAIYAYFTATGTFREVLIDEKKHLSHL